MILTFTAVLKSLLYNVKIYDVVLKLVLTKIEEI